MRRVKESSQGRHAACHMTGLPILSHEKHASPAFPQNKRSGVETPTQAAVAFGDTCQPVNNVATAPLNPGM